MSKKRPASQDLAKLRELLRGTSTDADLPYDVRWAKRVLVGEEAAAPEVVREEVVAALIEELVDGLASQALTRLASGGHKVVSKAARTGLHRLRSQKVAVEVPVPQEAPRTGTGLLEETELAGVVSMYDGRGQRVVWLASPASRGILLHQARISAAHGLVDFETYSSTRGRYNQLVERVGEQMLSAKVPRVQAHWFVEEAAHLSRRVSRGLPEGYATASQLLGAPPEAEHPALSIEPAQVEPQKLLALFEERALSLWMPERSFLQKLDLKLQEIATSRIVVDDKQRSAQMSAALEKAVLEYHTPERIEASRRLLLDTAHLMSLTRGPAGLARAAADLYLLAPEQLGAHPFARTFIERLVRLPGGGSPPDDERRSDGGLVLPGR